MKRPVLTLLLAGAIILLPVLSVLAADMRCAECGMMVDTASKFSARILQGDTVMSFCDIGDLFSYLKKKEPKDMRPEVKDYKTGEWVDAKKAYYVHAEKKFNTPMGWGIAAFTDKIEASQFGGPVDFAGMAKTLK
jgi:nitrous oxide reductase accessory protein NosL